MLAVTALLSLGMFLFADRVLPETNQRQNGLRNQIKGKPAQTFYRPDHQWIFGTSSRIYNYTFFDPDQNVFANLSVFEFDPVTFRMTRRMHAARAVWEAVHPRLDPGKRVVAGLQWRPGYQLQAILRCRPSRS